MHIIEHNWAWRHGLSRRSVTDTIVLHHAAIKTASAETYIRFDAPCADTSAVVITRNQPLPSE